MNWLEAGGVLTGLLAVWLTGRRLIWCWPVALVNVSIYFLLFVEERLYADAGLQVFYFMASIYGWYYWGSGGALGPVIKKITPFQALQVFLFILGSSFLIGYFLKKNTDASLPYLDSFLTASSLAAQWLMARKILENWIIWFFVNFLYVGLFIYKSLFLSAGLYAVFIVLAVIGYTTWQQTFRSRVS